MPQWLRNAVMIVGLTGWLAVVVTSLARGHLPDAILLGVPACLVLALSPPKIGRGNADDEDAPPADGART